MEDTHCNVVLPPDFWTGLRGTEKNKQKGYGGKVISLICHCRQTDINTEQHSHGGTFSRKH